MFDHRKKDRALEKSDLSIPQQAALYWYGYRDGGPRRKYDGGGVVSGINAGRKGYDQFGVPDYDEGGIDFSNLSEEEKAQLGLDATGLFYPPAAYASSGIDYKNMLKSMKGGNWSDALYYGGMGTLGLLPWLGAWAKSGIKGGKTLNTISQVTPYVKPTHKTTKVLTKTDKYTDAAGDVIDPFTYEYTEDLEKKSKSPSYDFTKPNPYDYQDSRYWDWQRAKRQNTLYGK
jgi:hypothetical protein